MDKNTLDRYGIDYDAGITRCANDPKLYEMLLVLFLDDDTFKRAKDAYIARDNKTLFGCVHELKGVSGNISLTGLYGPTCMLLDYMRKGNADQTELDRLFSLIEYAYEHSREGISLALTK